MFISFASGHVSIKHIKYVQIRKMPIIEDNRYSVDISVGEEILREVFETFEDAMERMEFIRF